MMNLLAIDTATDIFSVAVSKGDKNPLRSPFGDTWLFEADVGLRHSELSMDCVNMLLRQAGLKPEDLNGVICMGGPGSFTGLRIGFSLAKGLACALGIPFAAVPTLDCMAWPFSSLPETVAPVIDAKKGAFFCAFYQKGKRLRPDMDATPGEIADEIAANHCPRRAPSLETADSSCAGTTLIVPGQRPLTGRFIGPPLLLTGPGAPLLYDKLCAMGLEGDITWGKNMRWGNAASLLHIARETDILTRGGNGSSSGPEYIRRSV
jgi:tRNA threonylcarbamoyladenosine biosynthesis protein TsaB